MPAKPFAEMDEAELRQAYWAIDAQMMSATTNPERVAAGRWRDRVEQELESRIQGKKKSA